MSNIITKVLNSKHMPDRAAIAAGLSGILTAIITSLVDMDTDTATLIVTGVMAVVNHLVPESVRDLVKKTDDVIKANATKASDIIDSMKGIDVK